MAVVHATLPMDKQSFSFVMLSVRAAVHAMTVAAVIGRTLQSPRMPHARDCQPTWLMLDETM